MLKIKGLHLFCKKYKIEEDEGVKKMKITYKDFTFEFICFFHEHNLLKKPLGEGYRFACGKEIVNFFFNEEHLCFWFNYHVPDEKKGREEYFQLCDFFWWVKNRVEFYNFLRTECRFQELFKKEFGPKFTYTEEFIKEFDGDRNE